MISMDHYLTVRHFTVAEELENLYILYTYIYVHIFIYIYVMILANTPPPSLNAATLRTFKKSLASRFFVSKPSGPFPLREKPFCPHKGLFCFLLPLLCNGLHSTPLPQVRNISPRCWEMGPSLQPGEGLESWLGTVTHPGVFHLGIFSQGRCQAPAEGELYYFLFPTSLFSPCPPR